MRQDYAFRAFSFASEVPLTPAPRTHPRSQSNLSRRRGSLLKSEENTVLSSTGASWASKIVGLRAVVGCNSATTSTIRFPSALVTRQANLSESVRRAVAENKTGATELESPPPCTARQF